MSGTDVQLYLDERFGQWILTRAQDQHNSESAFHSGFQAGLDWFTANPPEDLPVDPAALASLILAVLADCPANPAPPEVAAAVRRQMEKHQQILMDLRGDKREGNT